MTYEPKPTLYLGVELEEPLEDHSLTFYDGEDQIIWHGVSAISRANLEIIETDRNTVFVGRSFPANPNVFRELVKNGIEHYLGPGTLASSQTRRDLSAVSLDRPLQIMVLEPQESNN